MYTITKEKIQGKQLGKTDGEYICYGLIDKTGNGVVPHCHHTPEEAVGELIYFLRLNQSTNRKFLAEDLSVEEINQIEKELLEQSRQFNVVNVS